MRRSRVLVVLLAMISSLLATVAVGQLTASATAPAGGTYVPLSSARLLSAGTWAGGTGTFGSGETRTVPVLGKAGIPASGVSAIVVDIAGHATTATTSNFLTAWPSGIARPSVSSLYFTHDNAPRSNTIVVKVGSDGAINVFNYAGTTSVTVDVQGYFTVSETESGGFVALNPVRVANTAGWSAGANVPQSRLAVGNYFDVTVAGVATVAASASSVYVNVEVRNATTNGTLWIGPGGSTQTWPQSMEYDANGPYNSGRAVKLDSQGRLRIKNLTGSPIDLKIDVQGYFSGDPQEGGAFTALAPANVYSTGLSGDLLQGGETRTVTVSDRGGLPQARAFSLYAGGGYTFLSRS